jgi:hypothetical protein
MMTPRAGTQFRAPDGRPGAEVTRVPIARAPHQRA